MNTLPDFIDSDIVWIDHIHQRLEDIFLGKLTHRERFCELYTDENGTRPVGIWGWNTWCGIHDMTPLVGESFHRVMRNTLDEGLSYPEPGTGLLPHSVPIDRDGRIGYRDGESAVCYRTYFGVHGEDYCLDNIICWAKMVLEYFLYTRNEAWFSRDKLEIVERSTDFILEELRSDYNPDLLESGIEGDWTENTDWHADNSNNNVCMIQCLRQLIEVESMLGRTSKGRRYSEILSEMEASFVSERGEGGFWEPDRGFFLHGNDGKGGRVYGDEYFESTANFFALLLGIASGEQSRRIWSYVDGHPEIEDPLPVMTNHLPRTHGRRMRYGQTITDGDVWLTLGAHAAAARLRHGFRRRATKMYRSIIDYEKREGTIHNSIFRDGSRDEKWSPEIGNYGSMITPLTEGILGLQPMADGLRIEPNRTEGMRRLATKRPLTYAGKEFFLEVRWNGGTKAKVSIDGESAPGQRGCLLRPEYENGSLVRIEFS
jgi:hypothetical protein